MTTILQVRRVFAVYPKYSGVAANENLVLSACENRENVHIGNEIEKLGAAGKLAISPVYTDAYQRFFQQHPELALDCNMALLDSVLVHYCESTTLENLEELLLAGNPRNVLGQLAITASAAQAQADEKERSSIINEIIGGFKTAVDGRGHTVCTDASGHHLVIYKDEVERVKAASLEDLRTMRESRAETRRLRSMPVESLRQVVREASTEYSRYEKLPDPPSYSPPGKPDVKIPFTFQLMKRLPSMELKRLLSRFGDEQISAACRAAQGGI